MTDAPMTAAEQRRIRREQAEREAKGAAEPVQPEPEVPVPALADLPDEVSFELNLNGRDFVIERPIPDDRTRQLNVPIGSDMDDMIVQVLHAIERAGYRKVTKGMLINAWLERALLGGAGGFQQIAQDAIDVAYPRRR